MATREVLVIGATGRTGGETMRQLRAAGVPTRALIRDIGRAKAVEDLGVRIFEGELSRRDSLEIAMSGVDRVFLAVPHSPQLIQWCENLVDAANSVGKVHIVRLSGFSASPTAPAAGHRLLGRADEVLRASGLPCTILRPNVFFQNMLPMAEDIRRDGRFSRPAGDAPISMIDVVDIAAAATTILKTGEHIGMTYDLTGPEFLSYHDAARILSAVTGRAIEYVPVTVEQAIAAMVRAGHPEAMAKFAAEIQSQFATGVYAPITRDLPLLLDRPPRRFKQFAREHAHAFQ